MGPSNVTYLSATAKPSPVHAPHHLDTGRIDTLQDRIESKSSRDESATANLQRALAAYPIRNHVTWASTILSWTTRSKGSGSQLAQHKLRHTGASTNYDRPSEPDE